ncbi:hypothetical protein FB451DRAFT_1489568 [Mycena latifolia]|nr:hypothetical protein FB451DRAFT_1489568 [Mycena latifolia]
MASTPDPSALQKAEALWFSPEVVILRAQTRIFRVFPPSSDMETMEGSPVVTVHDDPEDMEVFLKAMFDAEFFMPPPAQARFRDVIGILRLSHKYDVPFLRRPRVSGIANVCEFPIQDIMAPGASWDALGEAQKMACIVGHSAQVRQFPNIIAFHFAWAEQFPDCVDWTHCGLVRLELAKRISWEMTFPLDAVDEDDWGQMKAGLCSSCWHDLRQLYQAAKQTFWDELLGMFELPAWAELEEMRGTQLGEGQ